MFKKQNKEVVESKEEAVFDNSGVPVKYGGLHGKTLYVFWQGQGN